VNSTSIALSGGNGARSACSLAVVNESIGRCSPRVAALRGRDEKIVALLRGGDWQMSPFSSRPGKVSHCHGGAMRKSQNRYEMEAVSEGAEIRVTPCLSQMVDRSNHFGPTMQSLIPSRGCAIRASPRNPSRSCGGPARRCGLSWHHSGCRSTPSFAGPHPSRCSHWCLRTRQTSGGVTATTFLREMTLLARNLAVNGVKGTGPPTHLAAAPQCLVRGQSVRNAMRCRIGGRVIFAGQWYRS